MDQHILVDILGMKRVLAMLVPRDLNFLQTEQNIAAAPTSIKRIITGDTRHGFIDMTA